MWLKKFLRKLPQSRLGAPPGPRLKEGRSLPGSSIDVNDDIDENDIRHDTLELDEIEDPNEVGFDMDNIDDRQDEFEELNDIGDIRLQDIRGSYSIPEQVNAVLTGARKRKPLKVNYMKPASPINVDSTSGEVINIDDTNSITADANKQTSDESDKTAKLEIIKTSVPKIIGKTQPVESIRGPITVGVKKFPPFIINRTNATSLNSPLLSNKSGSGGTIGTSVPITILQTPLSINSNSIGPVPIRIFQHQVKGQQVIVGTAQSKDRNVLHSPSASALKTTENSLNANSVSVLKIKENSAAVNNSSQQLKSNNDKPKASNEKHEKSIATSQQTSNEKEVGLINDTNTVVSNINKAAGSDKQRENTENTENEVIYDTSKHSDEDASFTVDNDLVSYLTADVDSALAEKKTPSETKPICIVPIEVKNESTCVKEETKSNAKIKPGNSSPDEANKSASVEIKIKTPCKNISQTEKVPVRKSKRKSTSRFRRNSEDT